MAAPAVAASRRCLVAVAQMTSTNDMAANFAAVAQVARDAASRGARMLFLPECFNFFGAASGEGLAIAEPVTGPIISRYCALAAETGLWMSMAGFQEKTEIEGKVFNTHVVVDSSGSVKAVYRKMHLFDLDHPVVRLKESEYVEPGSELVLVDTPAGRLGMTTCYDVRFPGMFQALVDAGAQLLAVPSAFTVPTGSAHWEVLMRARAIETQCYVLAAAQVGKHNEKRTTYGHAMAVDPWGAVLAQAGDNVSPGAVLAEIDLDYLADVRSRMPVSSHKRPPLYAQAPTVIR